VPDLGTGVVFLKADHMLMPKLRLPLWIAAGLPLAAYAYRSIVVRGGDWRPDLPWDPIVFICLAMLIALVAWARRRGRVSADDVGGYDD